MPDFFHERYLWKPSCLHKGLLLLGLYTVPVVLTTHTTQGDGAARVREPSMGAIKYKYGMTP